MPFDPNLLPRLLETFYPVVTPANLALARQAFPDWFGGGVLFGSKGDKLRLPDGREYDCIFAAGGPIAGRRWQCAIIDPNAPRPDDAFPLEPGPLEPLVDDLFTATHANTFEALVGQYVADTRGVDAAMVNAQRPVIDLLRGDPDAELSGHEAALIASQRADRATLGELYAHDEIRAGEAVNLRSDEAARDVSDVQAAHRALSPRIDDGAREFPPEPTLPGDVDPRDRDPSLPPRRQA